MASEWTECSGPVDVSSLEIRRAKIEADAFPTFARECHLQIQALLLKVSAMVLTVLSDESVRPQILLARL
jgi:hypothetical protein